MLDALVFAIRNGDGLIQVSGEVGAGKTMLSRMLLNRLPEDLVTVYLSMPTLGHEEVLRAIAEDLGVGGRGLRGSALVRRLQERLIELHAAGRGVIVVIDEAHTFPAETLEEIRLLSNLETGKYKLLQIVLFGQPELDTQLARREMRQLKERIVHRFELDALGEKDVAAYIDFRLRAAGYQGPTLFDRACVRLVRAASGGLTRRINLICDKTLLAAYADATRDLRRRHVRVAIRDADFAPTVVRPARRFSALVTAAALVAGVVLGGGIAWALLAGPEIDLSWFDRLGRPATADVALPAQNARPHP